MIGLCLSGGGIKAAAHIGVLKAFEESKIKIDAISGASAGSIVAVLYANEYSANDIYMLFKKYSSKIKEAEWKNILKLILTFLFTGKVKIKGLNSGENIEKFINIECKNKDIREFKFPLFIPAVNAKDGKLDMFSSINVNSKYINKGNIGKIVRSSCSYPGVFEPCNYMGKEYIDGGIRENTPWKVLKEYGVDKIIGVIFNKKGDRPCCKNIINVISTSLDISAEELKEYEIIGLKNKIVIETEKIDLLDTTKIDELYAIGYDVGKEFIKRNYNLWR